MITMEDRIVTMAPSGYLKLYTEHPERIERARMIPPRLGKDRHFGKMRVVLRRWGTLTGLDAGRR